MSLLYVLRHTEPDGHSGLCYGQSDLSLSAAALSQLVSHSKTLELPEGVRVYSSPSQRCLLLAQVISPEFTVDPRLLELNFGQWEGRRWRDLSKADVDTWLSDYLNRGPPDGESLRSLIHRLYAFLQELEPEKPAVLVTHATVLRLLLNWAGEFNADGLFKEKLEFGDHRIFSLEKILAVRKPLGLVF